MRSTKNAIIKIIIKIMRCGESLYQLTCAINTWEIKRKISQWLLLLYVIALWDKNTALIQWNIYANDFYFKIAVDYPEIKNTTCAKSQFTWPQLELKNLDTRKRHCWLRVKNVEYVCYQIRPFLHKLSSGLYKIRLKCIKKQTS